MIDICSILKSEEQRLVIKDTPTACIIWKQKQAILLLMCILGLPYGF